MSVNAGAFVGTWPWSPLCWSPHATKSGVSLLPRQSGLRISRPICARRLKIASASRQATRTLCASGASRSGRRLLRTSSQYAVKPMYSVQPAIPSCCSLPSSRGMTSAMILPVPSKPRPAWAARSPRQRRSTSILWCAAMRAADRRTSCGGGAAPVPPMPSETSTVLSGPTPPSTGAPTAPAAQPQPSATGQAPPATTHASGTVVMRQNGNIRTAPQGETIRVEPQGKELRVFGEAPGGWLQIGDTEANGWVHSSLVQRR